MSDVTFMARTTAPIAAFVQLTQEVAGSLSIRRGVVP
jgi:hypothetical protein